jgi:histone deacetylase 1/2
MSTDPHVQGVGVPSHVPGALTGCAPDQAINVLPIYVHGDAMHTPSPSAATELRGRSAGLPPPTMAHGPQATPPSGQPTSPSAALSAATSSADPSGATAPQHAMITRHRDQTRREKMYTDGTVRYDPRRRAFFAAPSLHREALLEPTWHSAMADEFPALRKTGTWIFVPRPPGVNIVGSKWIFKTKHRPDGSIDKHKARLVARGFTQRHGIDYGHV